MMLSRMGLADARCLAAAVVVVGLLVGLFTFPASAAAGVLPDGSSGCISKLAETWAGKDVEWDGEYAYSETVQRSIAVPKGECFVDMIGLSRNRVLLKDVKGRWWTWQKSKWSRPAKWNLKGGARLVRPLLGAWLWLRVDGTMAEEINGQFVQVTFDGGVSLKVAAAYPLSQGQTLIVDSSGLVRAVTRGGEFDSGALGLPEAFGAVSTVDGSGRYLGVVGAAGTGVVFERDWTRTLSQEACSTETSAPELRPGVRYVDVKGYRYSLVFLRSDGKIVTLRMQCEYSEVSGRSDACDGPWEWSKPWGQRGLRVLALGSGSFGSGVLSDGDILDADEGPCGDRHRLYSPNVPLGWRAVKSDTQEYEDWFALAHVDKAKKVESSVITDLWDFARPQIGQDLKVCVEVWAQMSVKGGKVVARYKGKVVAKQRLGAVNGKCTRMKIDTRRFSTTKKNVLTFQYLGNKHVKKSAKITQEIQKAKPKKKPSKPKSVKSRIND